MKQFELLAPAGDFSCMTAAFNAGADAVYLAGKSFGARAFAGNFETEELIEALSYAHLFSKKIYMTLNTLIKETEFGAVSEFLQPFYENGLDGVIIQDMGLIPLLKKEFPGLELHGSTQMTVSNYRSAAWLKEQGLCRVVPARELSLEELTEIREKADIEVEAFIHGAMCYSYSGQCLFSSFLGGRSGNRGRCAQPCRLPYKVFDHNRCISPKQEVYPLSLKDLCSIPYIYELMDGGVDSFKIEGRMKSPEYVAGVTAIYRKYMDSYISGEKRPIAEEDMEQLAKLYIRSDMKDGYLKKHNGKDMISLSSPSYQGCDDKLVEHIRKTYCEGGLKMGINGTLTLTTGCPAELTIYNERSSVTVRGDEVQCAQNRPLAEEDIKKQLEKTGNSNFTFDTLDIGMSGNVFMPVKKLNELRRNALDAFKNEILKPYRRVKQDTDSMLEIKAVTDTSKKGLRVSVMSLEQLEAVFQSAEEVERIYVPADLFYLEKSKLSGYMERAKNQQVELYLALPRMLRKKDEKYLEWLKKYIVGLDGVQAKSLEGLAFLQQCEYRGCIMTDHFVYNWNRCALDFMNAYRKGYTYPLELSFREIRKLEDCTGEYVVYGRTPMMISANCVRKTMDCCNKSGNSFAQHLQDRYKKELPVYVNCVHCYNEIFNAVPMSLHKELQQLKKCGYHTFRLDFTDESAEELVVVLKYFVTKNADCSYEGVFPLKEYTMGHFKEGAV